MMDQVSMLNMQYFTHPAGYPPESGAIILWAQDGMGKPKQPRASSKIVRVYVYHISYEVAVPCLA